MKLIFLSAFIFSLFGQNEPDPMRARNAREAMVLEQFRQNGSNMAGATVGGIGGGCFNSLMNTVSNGMQNSFQAQTDETNLVMGFTNEYYQLEMKCGNDLAQIMQEYNKVLAEQETKEMQLPNQIRDVQLEYEMAVLDVQQECEQTSGATFTAWKQQQSTGIVGAKEGGLAGLVGRQGKINKFQKLFYDDCLSSASNIKRVQLLGQQLHNKVAKFKTNLEASAKMLQTHSQNLMDKQGQIDRTCDLGRENISHKERLAMNNANTNNSMAQTNNFLGAIGAVSQCMGGPSARPGGNADVTGSSAIQ